MTPVKKKPVVVNPQPNVRLSVDPASKEAELTLKLTQAQLDSALVGLEPKKMTAMRVVSAVSKDQQNPFKASELNKALKEDRRHRVDKLSDLKNLQVRIRDENGRTYTLKDLERIVAERGIKPEDMEDRPIVLEDEGYKLAVDESGKAEMEVRLTDHQLRQALDAAAEPGEITPLEFLKTLSREKSNEFSLGEVNKRLKQDKTHNIDSLADMGELRVNVNTSKAGEGLSDTLVLSDYRKRYIHRLLEKPFKTALSEWERTEVTLDSFQGSICARTIMYSIHTLPELSRTTEGRRAIRKVDEALTRELAKKPDSLEDLSVGSRIGDYAEKYPRFFQELLKQRAGEDAVKKLRQQYNVEDISRYPPDVLVHMLQHSERTLGPDYNPKPLCVVGYAKHDHNGAFYNGWPVLHELSKHYDVRIVEAGYEEELMKGLRDMNQRFGKAKAMVLGGHGNPEKLRLGQPGLTGEEFWERHRNGTLWGWGEKKLIDLTDRGMMRGIKQFLDKDPYVILQSCSTGSPKVYDNLARTFSDELGETVYAARRKTYGVQLETREDGEISDMTFTGRKFFHPLMPLFKEWNPNEIMVIYKDGRQASLRPLVKSQPPAPGLSVRERIQVVERKRVDIRDYLPTRRTVAAFPYTAHNYLLHKLMDKPFKTSLQNWEKTGEKISSDDVNVMMSCIHTLPDLAKTTEGQRAIRKIDEALTEGLEKGVLRVAEYAKKYPRFFDEMVKQKAGEDAYKKLKSQYNIDNAMRYPTHILTHMIEDKERVKGPDGKPKPLCVAAFAKWDHNKFLTQGWQTLHDLSEEFDVRIIEAGYEDDLMESLRDMEKRFGKAKVMLFSAHSSPTHMRLGDRETSMEEIMDRFMKRKFSDGDNPKVINIKDKDNMREIKGFLDKDPYVILNACSTGKPQEPLNLAKTFSDELGDVVFAARRSTTGVKIKTREDGEVEDIRFYGKKPGDNIFRHLRDWTPEPVMIVYKDGRQVSLNPLVAYQPPSVGQSIRERIR